MTADMSCKKSTNLMGVAVAVRDAYETPRHPGLPPWCSHGVWRCVVRMTGIGAPDGLSGAPTAASAWLESIWPTVAGAAAGPPREEQVLAARLEDAEPLPALADREPGRYAGLVLLYRV